MRTGFVQAQALTQCLYLVIGQVLDALAAEHVLEALVATLWHRVQVQEQLAAGYGFVGHRLVDHEPAGVDAETAGLLHQPLLVDLARGFRLQ